MDIQSRRCLAIPEAEKGLKFIAAQYKPFPGYDQRGERRIEKDWMLMDILCVGRAIKRTWMATLSIFGSGREKKNNRTRRHYDQILNLVAVSMGDNVRLPEDLVVEILCKLPVKPLLRFKTVCKSWNLLINSHVFIHKHVCRDNPEIGGYSVEFQGNILPFQVSYIVGACNGILCLYTTAYESSRDKKKLVLFNPSTREFSFVPRELLPGWGFYGFCYVPATQEYQIILFRGMQGCKRLDITTLTLGKITSSREAKNIMLPGRIPILRQTTNGTTMFWLGIDHVDKNEIVICYDVIEGRFSKMNMPPYPSSSLVRYKSLGVLRDLTILFVTQKGATFFDMWMVLDGDSNEKHWMIYRTVGPLERPLYPIDVCWYRILCSRNDAGRPLIHRPKYWSNDLLYYDVLTEQVENYCDFHKVENYKWHLPIGLFVNYVESLVSIKSLVPYIDTDCPMVFNINHYYM